MLSTVEPLELLDADEVETLQPMLRAGMLFAQLLDRKNRPPIIKQLGASAVWTRTTTLF